MCILGLAPLYYRLCQRHILMQNEASHKDIRAEAARKILGFNVVKNVKMIQLNGVQNYLLYL